MSTLTEFLLARIADDEQRARDTLGVEKLALAIEPKASGAVQLLNVYARQALAECVAKRNIIALHHSQENWTQTQEGPAIMDFIDARLECACCSGKLIDDRVAYPCDTLRILAQPYAGHPEFNPEWRA